MGDLRQPLIDFSMVKSDLDPPEQHASTLRITLLQLVDDCEAGPEALELSFRNFSR